MIMLHPQADIFDENLRCGPDVCLPLLLTVGDRAPIRLLFAHVHRP